MATSAALVAGAAVLGISSLAARPVVASPGRVVAQLTGSGSANDTAARFGITATDLGIVWDTGQGHVLAAFGDTYGVGWTGPGGGIGDEATFDWRSNVLLRSTDHDLADGMAFDTAAQDRPGHAGELLPSLKDEGAGEITVIPTAGVCVGSRQYLAYMSVAHWGDPGAWDTTLAGIAVSDDDGETWTTDGCPQWTNLDGDDPFQMGAFASHGRWIYLFGTPNGRFGDAHVARVARTSLLDAAAYEYWSGSRWAPGARAGAAVIVGGPVGELSVRYHRSARRWLMTYRDESRDRIVLRDAPAPEGPWGPEQVVLTAAEMPKLYGGFQHPWSSRRDLYLLVSQWDPYNVFLVHSALSS